MYCLPEARGTGIAHKLMEQALSFAGEHYSKCYLETLENMIEAQRFYQKHGFTRITDAIGHTGHFCCEIRYIKALKPDQ